MTRASPKHQESMGTRMNPRQRQARGTDSSPQEMCVRFDVESTFHPQLDKDAPQRTIAIHSRNTLILFENAPP